MNHLKIANQFKATKMPRICWISKTLEHYGFLVPDIFDNATMYEVFNQASDVENFDYKLGEIKNTILSNMCKHIVSRCWGEGNVV